MVSSWERSFINLSSLFFEELELCLKQCKLKLFLLVLALILAELFQQKSWITYGNFQKINLKLKLSTKYQLLYM